jgi:peptidoglycan hydrolase-like protein with peptidoglycan-binding domain
MIGIGVRTGRWWSEVWPGSRWLDRLAAARPTRRLDDNVFRQSLAELSRRARERSAQRSAVDPGAAAQARRAALLAYDHSKTRKLTWMLSLAAGVIGGTAIAALIAAISTSPTSTSVSVAPAPIAVAQEPPSPSQVASVTEPAPAPAAAVLPAQSPTEVAPSAATPSELALQSDEVREVQTRLRSFGFNPGPIDGVAGRMTEGAVLRYEQQRGQQQTGAIDRQLLEQLRQDPAPRVQVPTQVAQRPTRPDSRAASAPAPVARRADPLQPLKDGFDGLGRWIDSLVR